MSTKRRIDHTKNISSEKPLRGFVNVIPGDLITFKYRGKDIYDRQPLIFVLFKEGRKKGIKRIRGINLNYLKTFIVGRLLKETNFKNLKWYSLYEKAFRTYKISDIKSIKLIEWETSSARRDRKEEERKTKQLDK